MMKRCIRTACGAALCAALYAVLARFAVIACGAGHIRLQFALLGVPAALLGPTGGFLLSYPLCALLTGFLSRHESCSALRAFFSAISRSTG